MIHNGDKSLSTLLWFNWSLIASYQAAIVCNNNNNNIYILYKKCKNWSSLLLNYCWTITRYIIICHSISAKQKEGNWNRQCYKTKSKSRPFNSFLKNFRCKTAHIEVCILWGSFNNSWFQRIVLCGETKIKSETMLIGTIALIIK